MEIKFEQISDKIPNLMGSLFTPAAKSAINNNYLFYLYLKGMADEPKNVNLYYSSTMEPSKDTKIIIDDHKALDYVLRMLHSEIDDSMAILPMAIESFAEVYGIIEDSSYCSEDYRILDIGSRKEIAMVGKKDFIAYLKLAKT